MGFWRLGIELRTRFFSLLGWALKGFDMLCGGRREGERESSHSLRLATNHDERIRLTFTSHSQIEKAAPTRRQSPAKAGSPEPGIARSQSTAVRTECGLARRRRQSRSRQRGWPGQEWTDKGHEGQEEEDDQGGQLLEGDGLE